MEVVLASLGMLGAIGTVVGAGGLLGAAGMRRAAPVLADACQRLMSDIRRMSDIPSIKIDIPAIAPALAWARGWWHFATGPVEMRNPNPDLSRHVTIDEVIVEMGIEPTSDLTWAVGRQMRNLYEERYGRRPVMALRRKSSGKGSHEKAVYDRRLIPDIKMLVRANSLNPVRQEAAE